MKKLLMLALFLGLIGLTTTTEAQNNQGDFAIGLGVTYGSDLFDGGDIAINVSSNYSFTEVLRGALDLNYWLPSEDGLEDATFFDANLNVHFLFVNDVNLRLYGLAGLHYAHFSYEFDSPVFSMSVSDSEVGFNIGAGLEYDLGGVLLFVEPKYTVNGWEQFAATGGFRFVF